VTVAAAVVFAAAEFVAVTGEGSPVVDYWPVWAGTWPAVLSEHQAEISRSELGY